jgi:hypothetical protein
MFFVYAVTYIYIYIAKKYHKNQREMQKYEKCIQQIVYRPVSSLSVFICFRFRIYVLSLQLYLPSSPYSVDKSELYQRSNDEGSASHEPHFTGHNVGHCGHRTACLTRQSNERQNGADAWKGNTALY